jgi:hypothetical protein
MVKVDTLDILALGTAGQVHWHITKGHDAVSVPSARSHCLHLAQIPSDAALPPPCAPSPATRPSPISAAGASAARARLRPSRPRRGLSPDGAAPHRPHEYLQKSPATPPCLRALARRTTRPHQPLSAPQQRISWVPSIDGHRAVRG